MANTVGRPPSITKDVLQKLEEAFSNGATDTEACFIAGIAPATLYSYQVENPEFTERKAALKEMIKYQAKVVLKEKIVAKDAETAKWYLERKGKDEGFSARTEHGGPNGDPAEFLVKIINDKTNPPSV